ncbi:glycine cleavage system H protein [Insulibacter thermoxylanivorax]|uniref:Glycine cleavage system H protein n=1 Tax=Insulibacter thermoxylanivorax TaxID=2749268 RepID=A0A916QDW5_9BACL|nr:glycine cleavage system protein GcvH [Insulibacter thermoxylanivorax]GFR38951.1 glycine cleavage system H protein [Insulibacter thermoxylanivorax]
MEIPAALKYSEDHQWVRVEGSRVVIGMTEFAVSELGEIVFVELPRVGDPVTGGQPFGSVESVKTVSELYAPVSGKVAAINEALADTPGKVNEAPYGDGWLIAIEYTDASELEKLWSADKYRETYGGTEA